MKMIATTMRYENTFLLVGGNYNHASKYLKELSTIIKYEPGTGGWTILSQNLSYKNAGYIRMMVKSVTFPSCAIGKIMYQKRQDSNCGLVIGF